MKKGDTVKVRNSVLVSHGQHAKVVDVVSEEEMVLVKFKKPNVAVTSADNKQWFLEEDLKVVNQ